MGKLKGRELILSVASSQGALEKIAFAKSCEIIVQSDSKEYTSVLSGRGKRVRPGRYTWQVNVEALVDAEEPDDPKKLLQALLTGDLNVNLSVLAGSLIKGFYLQGRAIVTSWRLSGAVGNMVTFSATLLGDGGLQIN